MMPSISVVVPVYRPNLGQLSCALRSVNTQSVRVELVVVDDGCESPESIDRIRGVVGSFGGMYITNPENLGMARNWNKAVRCSSGEFVLVLGQDDELEVGALERHILALNECPDAVLSGGGRRFIGAEGEMIFPRRWGNDRSVLPFRRTAYCYDSESVATLCLSLGNVIGEPSAVLFRRSAFEAIGGYRETMRHAADLDFVLRASEVGHVVYTVASVVRRRLHETNLTLTNKSSGIVMQERRQLHAMFVERVPTGLLKDICRSYIFLNECRELVNVLLGSARLPISLFERMHCYVPRNPVALIRYLRVMMFRQAEAYYALYGDLI